MADFMGLPEDEELDPQMTMVKELEAMVYIHAALKLSIGSKGIEPNEQDRQDIARSIAGIVRQGHAIYEATQAKAN